MSQPPAKRKRKEISVETIRDKKERKAYVTMVNKGRAQGNFETENLCPRNCPLATDPDIKDFIEGNDFQIFALLDKNGAHTGYGRCTFTSCETKMLAVNKRVFQIQDKAAPGTKKQLLLRHFRKYHSDNQTDYDSDAQIEDNSIVSDSSQSSMVQFGRIERRRITVQLRKLPDSVVTELRRKNCEIVATAHTPLGFFGKQVMRERDQILLRAAGYDPDEVFRFDKGETTMKRDLFAEGAARKAILRQCLPQLANLNLLSATMDHQTITALKGEVDSDALGIGIMLSTAPDAQNPKCHRVPFLLKYEPVNSTANDLTSKLAIKVFQERMNMRGIINLKIYDRFKRLAVHAHIGFWTERGC